MDDNLRKIISNNIKSYMEFYNITQIDLANKLGVNQSSISLWINGERIPRMSKIDLLCQIFDCTRSDFLTKLQTSSTIRSSLHVEYLNSQIEKLNDAGISKVSEYINDLSSKYFI